MSVAIFSGGTSLLRFFSYASNATARFHSCRPIARSSSGVNGISATLRKNQMYASRPSAVCCGSFGRLVLELLAEIFRVLLRRDQSRRLVRLAFRFVDATSAPAILCRRSRIPSRFWTATLTNGAGGFSRFSKPCCRMEGMFSMRARISRLRASSYGAGK